MTFSLFGRLFLEEIQKSVVIEICREIAHESIKGRLLHCYVMKKMKKEMVVIII